MTFKEVYDDNFRFVWRSLRRLGVRESDVADAVQEVFVVVYRKLAEFEGRSKVTTWLFGICLRVARDRKRAAHERLRSEEAAPISDKADDRVDVGAEAERRQALAQIQSIILEMPEEQGTVFYLFELDGMSGEDIAEKLEVPLGTVHSRLRLAREQFRKAVARMHARDEFRQASAGGER
jgi:RNA polymerase sigma-70 factor (ECF subfamily)